MQGKVQVQGGDVTRLAGGHVEVVQPNDLRIAARAEIQDDGSFALETIHAGKPLSGVRPGDYQVRIVLSDEDRGSRRRRGQVLAPRFTQYKTSGLTLQAPTDGTVCLTVSTR
ncbi:hypothetical protein FRUB_00035 [Fimbriiglobus ruber]|uniref:Uncharacterized protein n=1 Tax=Fimbriiglobus ruber TaxID=1908690 RepID=A0A225E8C1_9BACT|nr:hypothetical protein FRUB_00035 [Fimbriiglobus ruber]